MKEIKKINEFTGKISRQLRLLAKNSESDRFLITTGRMNIVLDDDFNEIMRFRKENITNAYFFDSIIVCMLTIGDVLFVNYNGEIEDVIKAPKGSINKEHLYLLDSEQVLSIRLDMQNGRGSLIPYIVNITTREKTMLPTIKDKYIDSSTLFEAKRYEPQFILSDFNPNRRESIDEKRVKNTKSLKIIGRKFEDITLNSPAHIQCTQDYPELKISMYSVQQTLGFTLSHYLLTNDYTNENNEETEVYYLTDVEKILWSDTTVMSFDKKDKPIRFCFPLAILHDKLPYIYYHYEGILRIIKLPTMEEVGVFELPNLGEEELSIYPGNDLNTLYIRTVKSFGKYQIDITGE